MKEEAYLANFDLNHAAKHTSFEECWVVIPGLYKR